MDGKPVFGLRAMMLVVLAVCLFLGVAWWVGLTAAVVGGVVLLIVLTRWKLRRGSFWVQLAFDGTLLVIVIVLLLWIGLGAQPN